MRPDMIKFKLEEVDKWWTQVGFWFNPLWFNVEAWSYEVHCNVVH